jgi:hypothetical protein
MQCLQKHACAKKGTKGRPELAPIEPQLGVWPEAREEEHVEEAMD